MMLVVRTRPINAFLAAALVLLASAAASPQPSRPALDGDDGIAVMSDTPQWCAHLAAEVAALRRTLAGPHLEADRLAKEGRRLCGMGHVRLGLSRLRYALIELREH